MHDQLGHGVYARVHADGDVAIKTMASTYLVNGVKEAIFLASTRSPHVVALEDVSFTDVQVTRLTLKRYDIDLYKFMKDRAHIQYPFSIPATETLALHMFTGLHYIHSRGITHCDVKPQNLLINIDPLHLAICDFGISTLVSELRHSSKAQTCNYRAPEINIRQKTTKYTQAIDIWSAGCVLFELLSGRHFIDYRAHVEDTTVYLCEILGLPLGETRRARKRTLRDVTHVTIKNVIDAHLRPDTPPIMATLTALCLVPVANRRPTAEQALRILGAAETTIVGASMDMVESIGVYERFIVDLPNAILEACDYECLMLASKIYERAVNLPQVGVPIRERPLVPHACVIVARCMHNGNLGSLRTIVGNAPPDALKLALRIVVEAQGRLLCQKMS